MEPKPIEDIVELPQPFVQLDKEDSAPDLSSINRVTLRTSVVRERGGEENQSFPPPNFLGVEVPIYHNDPAFIIPDKQLTNKIMEVNTGWINEPRMISILNKTKWKSSVNPTEEQKKQISDCIILIGFGFPQVKEFPLRISPSEVQTFLLSPKQTLYIKALDDSKPVVSIFVV